MRLRVSLLLWLLVCLLPWAVNAAPPIDLETALKSIPASALELAHGDLYPSGAPDGSINLQDMILLQQVVAGP
ncbi:hypothetical protein ACFL3A_14355 [Pseudomonadota bacterium]